MKTTVGALLIFLSITGISISQSGWVQIYSPTNHYIYSTCFINRDTGFIGLDSGKIYKTLNGGINWIDNSILANKYVGKIQFLDNNLGFAMCYGTNAGLYRTLNGGINWSQIFITYDQYMEDICLINSNHIYIANFQNVLKTSNGGMGWDTLGIEQSTYNELQFYGVYFKNIDTGFVVGSDQFPHAYQNMVIWRTQNGGQNWMRVNTLSGCEYLRISFINSNTGYCAGGCSHISKSTNGGSSWFPINLNLGQYYSNLGSLDIINENKVFTCGRWGLYETTNAGSSWQNVPIPYESYNTICFPDSLTGYVAGDLGRIYKTTNGGTPIGIEKLSNETPSKYNLAQNYPNPFNPSTKIKFDIPAVENGRDRSVRMIIYDVLGREVATLVNEQLKPGSYEVEWDGSNYASGIYFYQLITEQFTETKRMVLIK